VEELHRPQLREVQPHRALRRPTTAPLSAFRRAATQRLRALGTAERAVGEKAYLKSSLEHWGVDARGVRATARELLGDFPEIQQREALLAVVADLWSRPVHDLRALAVALLERRVGDLEPADLDLLERMIRQSAGWAFVDWISTRLVGPLVERQPRLLSTLDRWAVDPDFWIRRAALLALLLPIRRGGGEWSRFVRYAEPMLDDREFFIRKAIGWVLREASKKTPDRVVRFIAPRVERLSGLTFREATRRLPGAALLRLRRLRDAR
jgi:3-methyladenine DNA glycosylase AlkD